MPWERAQDALPEIHRLRVGEHPDDVVRLASEVWAAAQAWSAAERVGLAAVCQAAFAATVGASSAVARSAAPLWRARATRVAAETGELAVAAMLVIPIAAQVADGGDLDTALDVLDEIGAAADELEGRSEAWSGPSLAILRRAHLEKQGHLLWRGERYAESLVRYDRARAVAAAGRDSLRVAGGRLLAQVGVQRARGEVVDRTTAATAMAAIAEEAERNGWNDVAGPARRNVALLSGTDPFDVQDLVPFEVEPPR